MLIGPDPAFKVPEIQFAPAHAFNLEEALAFVALGRALRPRLLGLHPPPGRDGGRLSETARRPLRSEHRRHGDHRRDDGRPHPHVRPSLCRRRRLRRHPVGAGPPDDRRGAARAAVRPEARRHHRQPRLRGLGRHLLAVPLPRGDARRRLRRGGRRRPAACGPHRAVGGDRGHGGDGRRRDRRRDDRDRHDLRDDARLRHHRPGDRRGGGGGRRPARPDRRDDLHRQAAPSRPSHPQGAAHQSLSGAAGRRT